MYLLALSYYCVITFLGYNGMSLDVATKASADMVVALPYLSRTEIVLSPIPVLVVLWVISLLTFDCATNFAPVLWCGFTLRKPV